MPFGFICLATMYTPPLFPPFPPRCCWPFCRRVVLVVEAFTEFSWRLDNTPFIKEEELIDDICATTFLLKLLLGEEEDVAPVEPLEALVALLLLIIATERFSLSLSSS